MKLRLRSLESNQTLKIEIPNSSTLEQLKQSLLDRIALPSSSSSSDSVFLSLNRKDELCGSSPINSIQSLGVTSGDLVYYSTNRFAFSRPRMGDLVIAQMENSQNLADPDGENVEVLGFEEEKGVLGDTQKSESVELGADVDQNRDLGNTQKDETLKFGEHGEVCQDSGSTQKDETLEYYDHGESRQSSDSGEELMMESGGEGANGVDSMEVDEEECDLEGNDKYSVSSFLRRVFGKELDDHGIGDDHRILVIAVHAVLLESGFVCYNPILGSKVEGLHLPDEWPSSAFTLSLCYSLPAILSFEVIETVVVKFQSLGKFVNVYGSLLKKGSGVYRVNLDKSRFIPALSYVWNHRDHIVAMDKRHESEKTCLEVEVVEFWRKVKDELSLPLLIDLSERAGLLPPPCFMRLPTDMKLKILELLPGLSVARMACVCTDLRFLSSNNDLWKLKFAEEFRDDTGSQNQGQNKWKARFVSAWQSWKSRKRAYARWVAPPGWLPIYPVIRRDPIRTPFVMGGDNDLAPPFRIGGDYDRVPGLGNRPHFGPGRQHQWPNCNFGGFNL